MKLILIIITWVVLFPLIGGLLERLGLDHNAYFAYYGAVFALCYRFIEQEQVKK